jgi:integrase
MQVTSEGPVKITKATIESAWRRRDRDRRLIVRDKDCRGLALIVNATSMTWSYAYRPRGTDPRTGRRWPNRTVTIGNPASHSPDDARNEANRIKGQTAAGVDPAVEKRAQAEIERRKRGTTLGRLAKDYALALPRRPKSRGAGLPSPVYVRNEIAQLKLTLAALGGGDMPARDLTVLELRHFLNEAEGTNLRARYGALTRFLDWCQDAGYIDANPCALVPRARRPKAKQPRANYLTPTQLAQLWKAADGLREDVWRDFARFLIAVPCRRGEAAKLEWSHLDFHGAAWHQPGRLTKNSEPHRLHLDRLALDALHERHSNAGHPKAGLVFPSPGVGKSIGTFNDIKVELSDLAGLHGWTWHDFRRSFATALGEAGISEVVADAVLNHRQSATRGGVLGVYQRASRWPEQVKAMELWGRLLAAAIEGHDTEAKVVPMTARTG